jgi:hypothetical protein
MSSYGELLTLRGATDGLALTGTFVLTSELLQAAITSLRIPRGGALKIWGYRISGAKVAVDFNFKKTLAGSNVPIESMAFDPALDSAVVIEKRKPVVVHSLGGEEAISVAWTQGVAALSYIDIDVEIQAQA